MVRPIDDFPFEHISIVIPMRMVFSGCYQLHCQASACAASWVHHMCYLLQCQFSVAAAYRYSPATGCIHFLSAQHCSNVKPCSLDPVSPRASHMEQPARPLAGGHSALVDTTAMPGDSVPSPLTPDHLLSPAATRTASNQNPPGVSVYRHHPPEAWTPIERFLHAGEDEDHAHKRARLHAPESVASASARPVASESSSKYGPFLNAQGLFQMSATRRLMPGVVTGLPGESVRGVSVPDVILKAHTTPNFRAVLVDQLPEVTRQKLLALPMDVQDTLLRTCMVVSSCWQNLSMVIDDAYNTWWSVWQQASALAAAPAAASPMRLAVFIARGAWGVTWTALETAVLILAKERPDLHFRFELAWIYDDCDASQQMTADITAVPEVLRGCSVTHRRDVGCFAEDVTANIASFKGLFWMALYPVPMVRQLELDAVSRALVTPHLPAFRSLWSWHRGVQLLDNHLGRAAGISIVGSSTTFDETSARELEVYFGSMCPTYSEELGRAKRQTQWFMSPCLAEVAGHLKLRAERHPRFRATDALPDGTRWAGLAAVEPGAVQCPPCLSPAYPLKVSHVSTGQDVRPDTALYCDSLRVVSPSSSAQQYGGVPFVIAHLGLQSMRVAASCSKWPCLIEFDIRDGKSRCPPKVYNTTCGVHLFCHNCRCVMEGLLAGWELASSAEVIANSLLLAASRWRGDMGPSAFMVFSRPPHACSDACCLQGQQ